MPECPECRSRDTTTVEEAGAFDPRWRCNHCATVFPCRNNGDAGLAWMLFEEEEAELAAKAESEGEARE